MLRTRRRYGARTLQQRRWAVVVRRKSQGRATGNQLRWGRELGHGTQPELASFLLCCRFASFLLFCPLAREGAASARRWYLGIGSIASVLSSSVAAQCRGSMTRCTAGHHTRRASRPRNGGAGFRRIFGSLCCPSQRHASAEFVASGTRLGACQCNSRRVSPRGCPSSGARVDEDADCRWWVVRPFISSVAGCPPTGGDRGAGQSHRQRRCHPRGTGTGW